VARAEAGFFPGHATAAIEAAVCAYRKVGCWEGGVGIPRDLYEQALNVFQAEGALGSRHKYDEVCIGVPEH
jgi:hypothetical protein